MVAFAILERPLQEGELPQEIAEVMQFFEEYGVSPLLFGGALSDHLAGKPFSDIDLHFAFGGPAYGGTPGWATLPFAVRRLFRVTPEHRRFLARLRREGEQVLGMRAAYSMRPQPHAPAPLQRVNLVLAARELVLPADVLNDCDLGFRQIAVTGGKVFTTSLFHQDMDEHTMTVCRAVDIRDLGRTLLRVHRFRARYAGWKMRISPELLERLGVVLEDF